MKKFLLFFAIISLSTIITPQNVSAANSAVIDIVEIDNQEPVVRYGNDRLIRIENAQGELVRIYDVTGTEVLSVKITSASQRIELSHLKKGCYIVKVGKTVRKISLK